MRNTTTVASIKIPCFSWKRFPRIYFFFHEFLEFGVTHQNTECVLCFDCETVINKLQSSLLLLNPARSSREHPSMWLNGFTSTRQAVSQDFATDDCI